MPTTTTATIGVVGQGDSLRNARGFAWLDSTTTTDVERIGQVANLYHSNITSHS